MVRNIGLGGCVVVIVSVVVVVVVVGSIAVVIIAPEFVVVDSILDVTSASGTVVDS